MDDSDEDKDYDEEKAAIDLTEQVYQDHFSTYANLPLQRDHSGERFVLALSPRYECAMSERARIIDLLSEGKIGADEAAVLLRSAIEAGFAVAEFHTHQEDLQELFLEVSSGRVS